MELTSLTEERVLEMSTRSYCYYVRSLVANGGLLFMRNTATQNKTTRQGTPLPCS
jgi:hypothetical protein